MRTTITIISLMLGLISLGQQMDNQRLSEILTANSDTLIGSQGRWQVSFNETLMLVLTDQQNDRMRIITPITEGTSLSKEMLQACLTANFHTALDVKYALSDELLWAVYIHPLSPLTEKQLVSALSQVHAAAINFGSSFSSTDLLFGGNQNPEEQKKQKRPLELKKG